MGCVKAANPSVKHLHEELLRSRRDTHIRDTDALSPEGIQNSDEKSHHRAASQNLAQSAESQGIESPKQKADVEFLEPQDFPLIRDLSGGGSFIQQPLDCWLCLGLVKTMPIFHCCLRNCSLKSFSTRERLQRVVRAPEHPAGLHGKIRSILYNEAGVDALMASRG